MQSPMDVSQSNQDHGANYLTVRYVMLAFLGDFLVKECLYAQLFNGRCHHSQVIDSLGPYLDLWFAFWLVFHRLPLVVFSCWLFVGSGLFFCEAYGGSYPSFLRGRKRLFVSLDRSWILFRYWMVCMLISRFCFFYCGMSALRHSRVFCTRWNGVEKTSINDDAVDDKEFSG